MRYIIGAPAMTAYGSYTYEPISVAEAKRWIEEGEVCSALGPTTAQALGMLVEQRVAADPRVVVMQPGDEALMFRLTMPLAFFVGEEYLTLEFVVTHHEMGLVKFSGKKDGEVRT